MMVTKMIPLLLLLAVIFSQLRNSSVKTLLSIMLIVMMIAAYFVVWNDRVSDSPHISKLESDTKDRREAVSPSFEIKRFGGKFKYLEENADFVEIAVDLRFIRIFDKARFGDLLIHMDKMQKVYMYILSGRYDPVLYISTFIDLRQATTEIMYSFYLVVPQQLQHTYGIDTYAELKRNVNRFTVATRKMLYVLYAFAKAQGHHVSDEYLHPYEHSRINVLP